MPLKTGAVIVAAGFSSRMHTFKPMLPLGNSTIIRTVIANLMTIAITPIALITGHQAQALQTHVADLKVNCLCNADYATTDMFHSVCIGLDYMQNKVERFFFMPGDVPLFDSSSLMRMTACMDESAAQIVIPAFKGRRGHPVLIHHSAISTLLNYSGPEGLKGAIATSPSSVQILELDDPGLVMDADTPYDYRLILHYAEIHMRRRCH